jgi:hypothetical protein
MTDPEALKREREALSRKLAKRRDAPGYTANVEAIKRRIAEIDAQLNV